MIQQDVLTQVGFRRAGFNSWSRYFVPTAGWLIASVNIALAGNWPAWRGVNGDGISEDSKLPLHWGTNQNVRWCKPLPDPGNSTPVIWGDRVFVTQAVLKENRRTLMCFGRRDGHLLWQAGTVWTEKESGGSSNPPCTPSPVTDGQLVIVWFGSAGVFGYDFEGRELWRRDLGRQSHVWGYASSPVLYGDRCLLNFGPGPRSFLVALDKRTGKTLWQQDLPSIGDDAKWEDLGGDLKEWKQLGSPKVPEVSGSCATPLVVRAAGREEVIIGIPLRMLAFDLKNGERLWSCEGPNTGIYGSPFYGDGLVGLMGSGLRNTAMVVRPGGRGDVTATHRLWHQLPSGNKACIGSGVIHRDHLYQVTMAGFAQCLQLKTGQTVWEHRLTTGGGRSASWSSPILGGDRLYVSNQSAEVFVLRSAPKFEALATNSIGDESMNASLAISDGALFLRTDRNLWCIAEPE
jgi:outer membrane protein assembly factor BamB